jgi:hypothetical protein|tara:strand:- start:1546 stop:2040 length:495 start_codon:yes stop_codon:yes gene_type:complete
LIKNRWIKKSYILPFIAVSISTSMAAEAKSNREEWHSFHSTYRVEERHGQAFMMFENPPLFKSGDKPYVVIHPRKTHPLCENGQFSGVHNYRELIVNGQSVQYGKECLGSVMHYYPINEYGMNYLISEFIESQSVEIIDGGTTLNFSAMGFLRSYREKYGEPKL